MKRTARTISLTRWGKGILAGLLLAGMLHLPAAADDSDTSRVRVAMYLDLGSTYKSTTPAVTIKTAAAAEAGFDLNSGGVPWLQLGAGGTARFSVNGYKVKALESADWATVAAAVKKLQGTADKPVAYAVDLGGTVYRVYTGPYVSAAEAQKAADRVTQTLSASLKGAKAEARGTLYISAGSFASQAEAENLRQTLSAQHAEAVVAMTGPQQYAVWVGGALSAAEQSALQTELAGLQPGYSWAPVNENAPALLLHRDVTLNVDAPAGVDHYELTGEGAKLTIRDQGNSPIQVVERSARSYRGDFEVSKVNGQLALVNELPLEQYLYSVVAGEVPSSWPQEALKAQAVAARSYALYNAGLNKFKVAGLVDTTLSQVYNGTEKEVSSIVQAVDATAGEVLVTANGQIVEGIFASNSGGVTADSSEVWGNVNPIYSSVPSDGDESAQASLKSWYQVLLSNGITGYVREDNTALNGTTPAGLQKLTVTTSNVLVRKLPLIQSDVEPLAKLNPGDQAIVLDKVPESSSYAWIRGPYSSEELVKTLKGKTSTEAPSPILNLEVTQRGPSGRVTQVKANGQPLDVKYPDTYRSALGGLPSTLFDIVQTGRYTVQGAGGVAGTGTATSATTIQSASGKTTAGGKLVVMSGDKTARVVEPTNQFVFVGRGNGHGLGLSQWGAKGLADSGYDYRQILQHYYQNVTLVKE
ncbi:MAG: SpoIID/LytB domain-containing protein [Paenibacillus sp.]|nr:SpoIID/LytB domain-containing protein [Paenibacillus sp.]MDU4697613.1 SpoIID/LytB domain-containing protein [Paenibacillus sp.]